MIRVGVAGAAGRMGRTTVEAVEAAEDLQLVGGADPSLGVGLETLLPETDVIVDFTTPDQALPNAEACLSAGVHVVIGTTGWSLDDLRRICAAHPEANAFAAPNFAVGAVLMMKWAAEAAPLMAGAEIVELHHPAKLDAPSGTAARTASLMEEASGRPVPIHSIRLPGIVADQEVILGDVAQSLTITHRTTDRTSFMPGVLLACRRVGSLSESPVVGLEHLLFAA